jgi:hypothetical protein
MSTVPGSEFFARMRTRMAWWFGMQMGGKRDLYDVFGWTPNPQFRDFCRKYQTNGVATRVIDAPVRATWADPPQLEGGAEFNKAWQDVVENTSLYAHIMRFDKLVGLGRYAILLMGFDDGGSLATEVKPNRERKLLYLQPYSEDSAKIKTYETNKNSPRFGKPLLYEIDPGSFATEDETNNTAKATTSVAATLIVHWTRVIHACDNSLESPVFGYSRLKSIFCDLEDLEKVIGGAAETFWLAANRGLHVDIDKDADVSPDDREALADELDDYANEQRRLIRTKGVTVKPLGSEVADPSGPVDALLSKISAARCIPKRVLMGSEAGQLASQQDRANWAIYIDEREAEFAQPFILKPLIVQLINAGVLPVPEVLTINWPDPFKMNPLERGQTSAQMARSATNLSRAISTMGDLNIKYATAAAPTVTPVGGGGGFGGFEGVTVNAPNDPAKQKDRKDSSKQDPKKSDSKASAPQTITTPALIEEQPWQTLLTVEEARSIIGFGKHPPVFDSKNDARSRITPKKEQSNAE